MHISCCTYEIPRDFISTGDQSMFSLIISSLEIFNKNIKADWIIIKDPMTTPNRPANSVFCSLDVYKSFYELLKYYF